MSAVDDDLDPSDVGLPHSVGLAVGVGDVVTEGNSLAADRAFCHDLHLRLCYEIDHFANQQPILYHKGNRYARGILIFFRFC